MLYHRRPEKIFLYLGIVDFRKQINGLLQLIDLEYPQGGLQNCWFIFISRNKKTVKILYWRGAGPCLWQYRLESEKFKLSDSRSHLNHGVSWKNLKRFLDGYNIFEGKGHEIKKPKRYS